MATPGDATVVPGSTYEVQPGDTLWSLSRRFGTTVENLMALNGINSPQAMRSGVPLVVPREEGPSAPKSPQIAASGSLQKTATVTKANNPESSNKSLRPQGSQAHAAKNAARYRFVWPVKGTVNSRFGRRGGGRHDGIDIGARQGAPVVAAADGKVLFAANRGGYGNLILIRHADGIITVYAHNQSNTVRQGQKVRAGQTIGRVGKTGRATGPHLHFEVRRGVKAENPLRHLPP
ncbi:MAG: hypothetical protein A2289_18340 [Deltaproteobacteria bacterium RIFOXYA12_FULL_58_15]|nr:MAG: hypothetical protein A2289_18340 [Deltaproteobacteria bacterium RIFOXYA12_FULL_58_15]OGR15099.1 MAG: hypothetical protein A2341_03810 [Deltaproteobacteria bacterium RIFOXYB12_FULL_58_9]